MWYFRRAKHSDALHVHTLPAFLDKAAMAAEVAHSLNEACGCRRSCRHMQIIDAERKCGTSVGAEQTGP